MFIQANKLYNMKNNEKRKNVENKQFRILKS
jgi:hypothetical protein